MFLQRICRRFNSWKVFLAVFFLFWQKIGFVKHAPFCQFPSTTHQASFVWPHAFRLFMCAYNVLCLCDCLSIVCETESSPLTEWRLFSLAEWWLSEKSGEKIRDEEWEGERVGECQKVRADGQKASVIGPSRSAPRMPQLVHISTGSDGDRLHFSLTDPILFSHTHTKSGP